MEDSDKTELERMIDRSRRGMELHDLLMQSDRRNTVVPASESFSSGLKAATTRIGVFHPHNFSNMHLGLNVVDIKTLRPPKSLRGEQHFSGDFWILASPPDCDESWTLVMAATPTDDGRHLFYCHHGADTVLNMLEESGKMKGRSWRYLCGDAFRRDRRDALSDALHYLFS